MSDIRTEAAMGRAQGWHLGINLGHDRAAALVRDGEIRVAIHQERLDRVKHSVGTLHQSPQDSRRVQLPGEAIRYCLDQCGIDWADLATATANMPGLDHGPEILERVLPAALRGRIRRLPGHHLAHAYSAWWPSGFERALVLVVDASGSATAAGTESYSLYRADGDGLQLLHGERVSSHLAELSTLGFLYEYVTRKAGFVTETAPGLYIPEAGKLMGLAPYGGPQVNWSPWIEARDDDDYHLGISAYDCFLQIAALEKRYDDGRGKPYLRPWLVDLAYKVQRELEQALLHLVRLALRDTGLRHLCLAGGVALNSVANYRLQQALDLEELFMFPAAGDAGIAAGCALWACHQEERHARRRRLRRASLGRDYGETRIEAALARYADSIEVQRLDPQASVQRTAEALAAGHIVARVQGGAEFGPRALGHRSILADPGFEHMRDILNARVKFRERFRPFAPVIPEEDVSQVFEQRTPSPFMLLVAAIRPEFHARIPSVTHVDGSGRIQTVTARDNPWLHALCRCLPTLREGPPVVLNTSFNVAGQPIVETPAEAIETFLAADIDYLALEDRWIAKRGAAVQDYREHLSKVQDSPLPHGLAPGQPSPDDLMRQLDRALFFGETDACPWSPAELRSLSAEGGKFKETGVRFADNPFGRPFRTRLSGRALLLLDPLGQSQLLDLEGVQPPLACGLEQVRLFMALLEPEGGAHLDALRRELGATTGEWTRRCSESLARLRSFGLTPHHAPPPLPADDPLPVAADTTLAPFADPAFNQWALLARVHDRLGAAGYGEQQICRALGVESLQRIEPTRLHYHDRFQLPSDPLGDLIRLFLLRVALPRERLEELLGTEPTAALAGLGLLIPRAGHWASRVDLYCVDDLYVATDHRYMLLEEDRFDEDPVMYIGLDSLGLVCTAPRPPVQQLLDLCTGSGVQALVGSRYAARVTGVDLNPRALRFARFNAQLNGIRNARFLGGDLYAPVAGERFDVILANPPFVPSPAAELGFRDGGARGEAVLARIVAEADEHLSEGGGLHLVSDFADVADYRDRLARWWRGGPVEQVLLHTADRDELLFSVPHSYAPFGQPFADYNRELARWVENFRAAGLRAVNFGYLLMRRLPPDCTSGYNARVVHSPQRPIHGRVTRFLELLERLRRPDCGSLYLRVNPEFQLRSESTLCGAAPAVHLLHAGDDPWYTFYGVDEATVDLLRTIACSSPHLGAFLHGDYRERVLDLLRKGILELSPTPPPHPAAGRADMPPPRQPPTSAATPIRELESKTTPTCLSSYMKR